jgi:signal transduction histidine kinase
MTRRLLLGYLSVTVVVLLLLEVPLAIFYAERERDRLTAEVERDASVIATIYEDALERGQPLDPAAAMEYERRTGARVVVTDRAGISEVDTQLSTPRDFSTRPEIAIALSGRRSTGIRPSETLDTDILYVALPVASGGVVHGAIRITLDTDHVDDHIHRFWLALVAIAMVVLAVMSLIGWAIARSVTRPLRHLNATAARFAEGNLTVDAEHEDAGPVELRELAGTMSMMASRLASLIDEQRAFVADASHQLRTPLTALRLRLENLQTRLEPAEANEVDVAIDETDRLASLVSDLLQLARADQRQSMVVVDLARIVVDRLDTWTAMADLRGVELRADGCDRAVLVHAAPGSVEQILDNVLDNALKVAPAGSEVVVSITPGDLWHRMVISDRGPGLSEDDKDRAVRRFWRGDTTTPGTGLGLAIASALALGSGGRLSLADAKPVGLDVIVELSAA